MSLDLADRIQGALYGMAYGDSFAMPPELWPRAKVKEIYGTVREFLDGHPDNTVSKWFKKGQFTDDTSQGILFLNYVLKHDLNINNDELLSELLAWAEQKKAFDYKFFGPSSEAVLRAAQAKLPTHELTKNSKTNGAAMRIAPIGCLFASNQYQRLAKFVAKISSCTHSTDVAISGAALIAGAVSAAVDDLSYDDIIDVALKTASYALQFGYPTFSASVIKRAELGLELAIKYKGDDEAFCDNLYDLVGAGDLTSESVPTALALAYYAQNADKCAFLCANLGGDSDTIGAMSVPICGAKDGLNKFNHVVDIINKANNVDFSEYVQPIIKIRERK